MKTLTGFGVLISTALFAAQPAVTNTPADFMIQDFLKAEAARLDARFLEGVTNRAMGSARATRAVFRAPAENIGRTELTRAFQKMSPAIMLDARRVQRHPRAGVLPKQS